MPFPVPLHSRALRSALTGAAALGALLLMLAVSPATSQAAPCTPPVVNAVACENTQPGVPPSQWEVDGSGDDTIQGFATAMSVNKGDTISFKIKSATANFHVDILRLGYYGGNGARMMQANLAPTGPTSQPACQTFDTTGLIDCGNWSVTRTWTVPSTAVSGVYIAHLVRNDTGGDSQIIFVVRDDADNADVVVQTSDATWQAYNDWGGNSLYKCTVACPPGEPAAYKAAYKVSYNRPLRTEGPSQMFTGAEYPMIRFLEANGYDATYISGVDVNRRPSTLLNRKLFISSGHDEYWSTTQRTAMENARAAGVNLAFFSGNEGFWKTRWESSAAGAATADRTLVSYKDTHFTARQDPVEWTGTWRDPRFTTAAENVTPENALTGQSFIVNSGTSRITVPYAYRQLRLWRNTAAASLAPNTSLALAPNTLGYEWDEDPDNGFRPAGSFRVSSTTVSNVEVFTDYGSTTRFDGTATHNMTLYRAPSGALVFGAGTVQWAFGLDDWNPGDNPADRNMQQATVNLFADMGAQPATRQSGLVSASASTDTTKPTATLTSPPATAADGSRITLSGTATDAGGGVVAGVEVSTDGGATWHLATGTSAWTYSWLVHGAPSTTIKVRATDDSGNTQVAGAGVPVTVTCPCSLWGNTITPATPDAGDTSPVEVGVKFKTDTFGTITGIRFYKSAANTGVHSGSLWTEGGQRLAQATFSNESSTGWQSVSFAQPVAVQPNTTYVASYYAPNGHYAATSEYFYRSPSPGPNGGALADAPPLHAVRNSGTTVNGLYGYGSSSVFPTASYKASNYWVDVNFSPTPAPGQVTGVSASEGGKNSANVTWSAPATGGTPTSYKITPYVGSTAQTPKVVDAPATSTTVTGLTTGTTYRFTVTATNPNGDGPASAQSNAGHPVRGRRPGGPDERQGAAGDVLRPGQLDRGRGRRRQPGDRADRHAVRRRQRADARAGRRRGDEHHGDRPHQRHELHVQGERRQRGRLEPAVRRLTGRDAAEHDLRLHDARRLDLRRPHAGRARRQVHRRLQRHDHGRPLLQGGRERRDPRRQPLERLRPAARAGDVHERVQLRLAGRDVRHAGRGDRGHDLRGLVLLARGRVHRHVVRPRLRGRRRPRPDRPQRDQLERRLRLRRDQQLPAELLRRRELLGRRALRAAGAGPAGRRQRDRQRRVVRDRQLDRAGGRRAGRLVSHHAVRGSHRADRQGEDRQRPGDDGHGRRPHVGHDLHVPRRGDQRERPGAGVGRVERRHPDGGRRARGAVQRPRRAGDDVRARDLGCADARTATARSPGRR